jgi:hypothetical protein
VPRVIAREFDVFGGDELLEVVGESFRQDALWEIVGGWRADYVEYEVDALLWPEPYIGDEGRDDPNAVKVIIQGHHVGYLSRHDAAVYQPAIVRLMGTCSTGRVGLHGGIYGGGDRGGRTGFLGVFLSHDPATFGISPKRASDVPGFRTGLAEAQLTDEEDDSYDLSWLEQLPANDAGAIPMLRRLLVDERDPIDRHYMLCELETRLYKSRDAFASALPEYDEVGELHHSEMGVIRAALFEKFERLPVLDVYRQAAIRAQKARDWEAVERWAQRGIEVYGSDAARPEAVDDLRKRLALATRKLASAAEG